MVEYRTLSSYIRHNLRTPFMFYNLTIKQILYKQYSSLDILLYPELCFIQNKKLDICMRERTKRIYARSYAHPLHRKQAHAYCKLTNHYEIIKKSNFKNNFRYFVSL